MTPKQFVIGFAAGAPAKLDAQEQSFQGRFCRYRTNYEFDESAPSSITVSGSDSNASRTYFSRSISTHPLPGSSFQWRSVLLVLYILFFTLSCIFILTGLFGSSGQSSSLKDSLQDDTSFRVIFWGFFVGLPILMTGLCGYLAGSRLYIDNATEKTVTVRIDGRVAAELPRLTYAVQRVGGSSIDVEVIEDGHLIESGKLALDSSLMQGVERAFFGQGRYVYNIGAANSYSVNTASYSR